MNLLDNFSKSEVKADERLSQENVEFYHNGLSAVPCPALLKMLWNGI